MVQKSAVDILKQVCEGLEARNIEYMVSGSYALGTYVRMRTSRDIDIVINLKAEDLDSFLEIFSEDFHLNKAAILVEVNRKGIFNVISELTGYKIDFIVKKNSEYRVVEFKRRRKKKLFDIEAWVTSPEDLILSKLIWIQELESGIQKTDIQNMLTEAEDLLDINYINFWIKKLNLKTYNLI